MESSPACVGNFENAAPAPGGEDPRHKILLTLLRMQFAASGVGVVIAFAMFPIPRTTPILGPCTAFLLALAFLSFAPLSYNVRARTYSLVFAALAVALALFTGPVGSTFLVMCGALVLPFILLSAREASGFVISTSALITLVAWLHIESLIPLDIPEIPTGLGSLALWGGGLITILTIFIPLSVLTGLLLRRFQQAHFRSEKLVEELRLEASERQAALEALQRAEQRLTHTQKLELLGQLAGGLAHDMNNALTAIMGEASFLSDSEGESRDIILESSNHAAQLTRQLLMLGRRDVVQPRALGFVEEIRRAVASVRRLLPSEIVVVEDYPNETLTVHADPTQIAQIVLNLVVNSRDAMIGDGELRVSVERSYGSSQVDLIVADTGHGIPPADLERIFEPFYSTKSDGTGTGLGLANVKELVAGLEGSLTVNSEVGRGTTFRLTFPLVDAAPDEGLAPSSTELKGDVRRRILLVDDSEAIRRTAKSILERAGYEVKLSTSGSEAIERLSQEDGGIDLVITDVVMPSGGGSLVLDWVKRERSWLPVLVMSGYTEDERLKRGMRTGELPFLRKPFSAEDLLAAIRKLLDGHHRNQVD